MLKIGLTGGIAAGKTTVAEVLAGLGAEVIDADALAREVVEVGSKGLRQVVAEFGTAVLGSDGGLDRPALGRVIFSDADARARLEAIVHPLVTERTEQLLAAMPAGGIVVNDVPLIVENGLSDRYHLVLVAGAEETERLRRLTQHRGMSEADARARIRAQANDDERAAVADVWIDSGAPKEDVAAIVTDLWHQRLVPFAHNIATGRRAPRAEGPVELVTSPSPPRTWAVQAEQLLARIRRSGGGRILSADHIGSTAVPGLAAKDVIDLQIGVADMAAADALSGVLQDAGFPRHPAITSDVPKPHAPDPAAWSKRLHGNADPQRAVNLHVREVDSPGWRYALALRDWLRSDDAVRSQYQLVKDRAAATTASSGEYAEAKEPWFTEVSPRLQAWIEQTGWRPHRT